MVPDGHGGFEKRAVQKVEQFRWGRGHLAVAVSALHVRFSATSPGVLVHC